MYPAARPLRVSVLSGLEIKLQWFITPMKASQTPPSHRRLARTPPSPFHLLGALSVLPLFPRSLTRSRRRGGIPIHKITLEKVGLRE